MPYINMNRPQVTSTCAYVKIIKRKITTFGCIDNVLSFLFCSQQLLDSTLNPIGCHTFLEITTLSSKYKIDMLKLPRKDRKSFSNGKHSLFGAK